MSFIPLYILLFKLKQYYEDYCYHMKELKKNIIRLKQGWISDCHVHLFLKSKNTIPLGVNKTG